MYRTVRSSGEANYTDYDNNYQQVTRSGYQFDYGGDLTNDAMELAGLQQHGNYFYGDSPVATVQVMEAEEAIKKM